LHLHQHTKGVVVFHNVIERGRTRSFGSFLSQHIGRKLLFHSSSVFSTVAFSDTLLEEANYANEERDGLGVTNTPESELTESECKDHLTPMD
jgi:hypothetical protein